VRAAAILSVLVLLLQGSCAQKEAPRPQTARVEKGPLAETVAATGIVEAIVTVNVGSQVSGTIAELKVDFNSVVKKG
jgi:HlyD family secretion protein